MDWVVFDPPTMHKSKTSIELTVAYQSCSDLLVFCAMLARELVARLSYCTSFVSIELSWLLGALEQLSERRLLPHHGSKLVECAFQDGPASCLALRPVVLRGAVVLRSSCLILQLVSSCRAWTHRTTTANHPQDPGIYWQSD